uniref:Serine aminopeptidase S33 domain-containing protein n=1 Tax=Oryza barthii TaxID=65489 RepID=A0A0D3F290_9ORYZ
MAPPPQPPTATKYFWGDSPEPDEYYASLGLRHAEAYFQSPCGRLFTHSFHPLSAASDGDVKGVVFMSHGYGSDSSWMFQNIAISYARWGYAVFCADLLGHGRSDGESFGEVAAPFLVVHGTDDGVTSPEGSRMLYERAASEDKSLILYDGMYHSLIQGESDENRDRVLADMRAWIDERVRRYGAAAGAAAADGHAEAPAA